MAEEINLAEIKQRAEDGDPQAQMEWAMCCFDGQGVEQDPAQAVEWLIKSADQNNPEAQYALAICYESGEGCQQDMEKAKALYAKCGMG